MINLNKKSMDERMNGMMFRNPSHINEAEESDDQRQIVDSLTKMGQKRVVEHYTFEDRTEVKGFPGVFDIRGLDKDNLKGLFTAILKSKPNIISVHLKLGDYPHVKKYTGQEMGPLNDNKPRWPSEQAEKFAELFANQNVAEIRYAVHEATPGNLRVLTEATVTEYREEYVDDELFKPELAIEYITLR